MKAFVEVEPEKVIVRLIPEGEGDETLLAALEGMEKFTVRWEVNDSAGPAPTETK